MLPISAPAEFHNQQLPPDMTLAEAEGDSAHILWAEELADVRAMYQRSLEQKANDSAETGVFLLSDFREGLERLERQDAAQTLAELTVSIVEQV